MQKKILGTKLKLNVNVRNIKNTVDLFFKLNTLI